MTSFILKCLLKRPISKYSHTRVRPSAYEFGEDTVQSKKKKVLLYGGSFVTFETMTKSQTCEHLPAERKSVPFAFMRHGFESSAPSRLE